MRLLIRISSWLSALGLAACASAPVPSGPPPLPAAVAAVLPADAVLVGEQHDAQGQARLHLDTVRALAARGQLSVLLLEMAEYGRHTAELPAWIDEAAVRAALQWDGEAWPWDRYGPAVMAAVRAGVPVAGANLPRPQMRQAMRTEALDEVLPTQVLASQKHAIAQGHCGLLPATQVGPMTRVQVARDRTMARAVAESARAGRTVVLLAGSGHVDPALGVPQHLPPTVKARSVVWPAEATKKDYCGELRARLTATR